MTTLHLISTNIGSDIFHHLSTFLQVNTTLTKLDIGGGDGIPDVSVASSLSDAIHNHPTLEELEFVCCDLLSGNTNILRRILEGCTKLKTLMITYEDEMSNEGATAVADFIERNHPAEGIMLNVNNLSDSHTKILASSLKRNTNLRVFDLKEDGNYTETGRKILLDVLFDATSMDSIVTSNHSCILMSQDMNNFWSSLDVLSTRSDLEVEIEKINRLEDASISQKIRRKVVLALCGTDGELFDLRHFNDIPLQLMPRVLELIQEHSGPRTKKWVNGAWVHATLSN